MTRVLLLVDLQNDFLAAPGLDPSRGELVDRAAALLAGCRRAAIPVLHARTTISAEGEERMPHWRDAGRRICVAGTPGHEFPEPLRPLDEPVFEKAFFSAFADPGLGAELEARDAELLILAGVHLHGCVRATAIDAYARGLRVVIAADATGSYDGLHSAASRRWLGSRGVRFERVEELLALDQPPPGKLAAEVEAAAGAAGAATTARPAWSAKSTLERRAVLERAATLLAGQADRFTALIASEVGKPVQYGRLEVERACELLAAAARLQVPAAIETGEVKVRRVPLGLVAQITPFNNPLAVPAGKLAPALALGIGVVWKPSPHAPNVAGELLALLEEAGITPGSVTLLDGGAEAAQALMEAEAVDGVSLTGSSAAGYAAQAICARRRIPLQAELGGNNAAIVWADADLAGAARSIAEAGLACAGQRCTANRRVIVAGARFAEFTDLLETAAAELELGRPEDPEVRIGPLVDAAARERVAAVLDRAADGAEIRRPGSPGRLNGLADPGRYLEPALVLDPDPGAEVVQRETFGPVIVVQRAETFDQALELLNGTDDGLVAALFSDDRERRRRFLAEARAGVLKLNRATANVGVETPFGGWGRSGVGPPEHGDGNVEFYTRMQAVYG